MEKLSHYSITLLLLVITGNLYANSDSIYEFKWLDEGEKVYVIQNKEHVKSGGLGVDFSIIDSDSSPYQDTTGFAFALTYYFSENWSVDATYKQYSNSDSADLTNLISANTSGIKPIIRKVNAAKLLHINWIPFYGKINTFNKIFFFDWGLGVGLGQFDTQGNYQTFKQTNIDITFIDEVDSGYSFRSFVKFYSRSGYTMGFEYNLVGIDTIKDPDGAKSIHYYTDIMATVGYIF